jgi:uncharacterized glyoxalase superfamily protein PhnB
MFAPVLHVRDVDLSLAFYTRVLGFQGEGGLPSVDGNTIYAEAYLGDTKIMFRRRSAISAQTYGVDLYLTLPETMDIHQYKHLLRAREVNIIEDLHDELWGDQAFTIADLDGYRLIISQPARYSISIPQFEKHIA